MVNNLAGPNQFFLPYFYFKVKLGDKHFHSFPEHTMTEEL